jgi:hypothetical protein
MHSGWIARTASAAYIACAATGCSGSVSPAAPSSALAVGTLPEPAPPTNLILSGRVTEAPPTTSTGVWDAVVTLDDGTQSWHSVQTTGGVGRGEYSISGLRTGQYHATVSADGFVTATNDITIEHNTTSDFRLLPTPVMKSLTMGDQIRSTDGACSDGTAMKPCQIIAIPVHNAGPIDATLKWRASGPVLMTITLFDAGQSTPLAKSASAGAATQRITARLAGGALYELRITYESGTATAVYSLSATYPN